MKNKSVHDRWVESMMYNRPLWYDSDMWKAGIVGVFVGALLTVLFRG
jgi:hypothetical protein